MLRNALPEIRLHPILMVFLVISFLTGTFVSLFIILAIVMVHELGHYVMAVYFRWRIRRIMIWIFGGVMDTDEHGTRPLYEEILVTIAGPLQHVLIYLVLLLLAQGEFIPLSLIDLALFYNTVILVFNLLPVWPLDGGKLLFLLLSYKLPYRKAYDQVILFSMAACIIGLIVQLFFMSFTLSSFMLFLFLLMENRTDWKQRYYVFIRFLLRRYYGQTYVKGLLPIEVSHESVLMHVFSKFHREKKHPIYIKYPGTQRRSIDEMDCLHSYFHERDVQKTIGEVGSGPS
ncbi:site-2 protease family protein [Virgibacillus siamensis]|uniref:site-2 protease family protein n=1 Tax=Virgibacillus siamensis TaxID=480071 RepID=UPI00098563B8|nr:site-2 protease family protein [Virgibacillus siamensis]